MFKCLVYRFNQINQQKHSKAACVGRFFNSYFEKNIRKLIKKINSKPENNVE
ncbi:MAG: hypothetical protein ACTSRZ_02080 [Promethearchaeota archaeon]